MGFSSKKEKPPAETPAPVADTSTTQNQAKLNPLILTSANGALDPFETTKKMLLGN